MSTDKQVNRRIQFSAEPHRALVDEPVRTTASGLYPGQPVTLISRLVNDGAEFIAHAHYIADEKGCLDLDRLESIGGSCTGVEPMGFIWALKAAPGQKYGLRLFKKDVINPLVIELSLVDGHVTDVRDVSNNNVSSSSSSRMPDSSNVTKTRLSDSLESGNLSADSLSGDLVSGNSKNSGNLISHNSHTDSTYKSLSSHSCSSDVHIIPPHEITQREKDFKSHPVLAHTTLKRVYQSSDVVEVPVREGKIRGSLFIPPGDGPFPGVIDMFGTAGGLIKMRAALLASRGFISLALPFFGFEDLPENIDLDLEYFEEAIEWFYSHPQVSKARGIGVIGVSKGATLALHCATISKKVRAVVSLNGYCCHSFGEHRHAGIQQSVVNPEMTQVYESDEGIVYGEAMMYRPQHRPALIPIEKAEQASILLVRGGDDPSCDPSHVDVLVDRLNKAGLNNYTVLDYPGAGHLIEPPYSPLCRVCYTKIIRRVVVYGGEEKGHAIAQRDSWRHILNFFNKNLSSTQLTQY